jgi:hypothetical protein
MQANVDLLGKLKGVVEEGAAAMTANEPFGEVVAMLLNGSRSLHWAATCSEGILSFGIVLGKM